MILGVLFVFCRLPKGKYIKFIYNLMDYGTNMRVGHVAGIIISGVVWLAIGCLLTFKGVFLAVGSILSFQATSHPLVAFFNQFFQHIERSVTCLVFIAIVVGMIKGRFVLAKTVNRFVKRILLIPSPLGFKDLFPWQYLMLIGSMMCIGMLLRFLPISRDIKAFIDLAVGSALINGAFLYFKQASMLKVEFSRKKK